MHRKLILIALLTLGAASAQAERSAAKGDLLMTHDPKGLMVDIGNGPQAVGCQGDTATMLFPQGYRLIGSLTVSFRKENMGVATDMDPPPLKPHQLQVTCRKRQIKVALGKQVTTEKVKDGAWFYLKGKDKK